MNVKKSLDRLHWRLSQNKPFTPNRNDVEAYNEIAEYCEVMEKQQFIDNQNFGKLYIYIFGRFCHYYKCGPEGAIPQKELHRLLAKPVDHIVQDFIDLINSDRMTREVKTIEDFENFEPLKFDRAAENLENMVNAAINTYTQKNKPNGDKPT